MFTILLFSSQHFVLTWNSKLQIPASEPHSKGHILFCERYQNAMVWIPGLSRMTDHWSLISSGKLHDLHWLCLFWDSLCIGQEQHGRLVKDRVFRVSLVFLSTKGLFKGSSVEPLWISPGLVNQKIRTIMH